MGGGGQGYIPLGGVGAGSTTIFSNFFALRLNLKPSGVILSPYFVTIVHWSSLYLWSCMFVCVMVCEGLPPPSCFFTDSQTTTGYGRIIQQSSVDLN